MLNEDGLVAELFEKFGHETIENTCERVKLVSLSREKISIWAKFLDHQHGT